MLAYFDVSTINQLHSAHLRPICATKYQFFS